MAAERSIMLCRMLYWILLIFLAPSIQADEQQPLIPREKKPNMLFILTDDQDLHMDSLDYMPFLQEHLVRRGTSFTRHFCTVALCCPSRASMWAGKAAHNTNVTDLHPPWGGYSKFVSEGFNDNYVPVWLQNAGYNTYYVGKLFNGHSIDTYNKPHAAGWTGSDFLLDPFTYRYLNATFQRNLDEPVSYEGQYSGDVLAEKTYGFLDDAIASLESDGKPFFLTVAPIAPHSDVTINERIIHDNYTEKSAIQAPPIPAERHKHLFNEVVVPRTPHFNPEIHEGASWIARLPRQNQTNIDYNDEWYRNRLRSLQAVDEMIDSLIKRLSEADILDNTYIFFSTDNGYTIGQHRRQPGKQCAYEEDINIPFIVRGPGIPEGIETDVVTSHTDLAPTFLSLARAAPPTKFDFDGQAIPLSDLGQFQYSDSSVSAASSLAWKQEHVNVEMWGIIMSEGKYGMVLYPNHTYKALRIVGSDYNLLYTIWCNNEHELYDMTTDPYQLINLYDADADATDVANPLPINIQALLLNSSMALPEAISTINHTQTAGSREARGTRSKNGSVLAPLIHRLDSLLMVLKTCEGRQCTHPWESLFPSGEIQSLSDALHSKFDEYFEQSIERVKFDQCEKGYIRESEGPMWSSQQPYPMFDEVAYQ